MTSIDSQFSFSTRGYTDAHYTARPVAHAAVVLREPVVFVVDDELNNRCIEALVCSHGYRVRILDSAAAFLRSIDASTPGCVLLNLTLPDATGLDVQRHLVASGRAQPVVFISNVGAVRAVVQAIKAGAEDFIELPLEQALLMSAVERAIERDRRQRERRFEEDVYVSRLELLTSRERQVLGHVIAGRLNKQIAARLGATEKTIKVHGARMMHKMSVRSVAELTRLADQIGVQPEA